VTQRAATAPATDPGAATFPRLLAAHAATRPDAIALQEKRHGIWQTLSWREYEQRVRDFSQGLAVLGVRRGQVVAVLGDNRPEWLIAELGAQCLGALVVGIYPTSIGEELVHILSLAECRVVVAEDQEQVDKLLALRERLPRLQHIIYYDPRGLERVQAAGLLEFTQVEGRGRAHAAQHPAWLDAEIARGSAQDPAVICTTSGTTSRPKLALLSHANLLSMGQRLQQVDALQASCRYVSFLPLAWMGEQMLALACGLLQGFTLSFPEAPATVRSDLREIGPEVLFSPPRIWESLLSDVQVQLDQAGWLKRKVFGWAYEIGDRVAALHMQGARPGALLAAAHRVADATGLRPLRDQLGLSRLRRCYTGGAPLSPGVFRFFRAIGVNLKQIYGQTEICGIAVCHRDDDVRFHSVGTPLPGTELRIAPDGEILLRSTSVFLGYLQNPLASELALDAEGWLHTGDAGYLDGDHLVVIDRRAEVLEQTDGSQLSRALVENKLKFSPYVEEAVSFAVEGGMTAIVCLDLSTSAAWAEQARLAYTTYADLATKPELGALIAEEVARANTELPETLRVRHFVLLHKPLDPDDDELTRTRKVRRGVVGQRYADIIGALARGEPSVDVHSSVTYQDGSRAQRAVTLPIWQPLAPDVLARCRKRPAWSGRS
jgi:long-chain acyl-CoA synthetase